MIINGGGALDPVRLQESWQRVSAHGDAVALHFYSHLALSRPDLRRMFPVAMRAQRDRFVAALGHIVAHAGDLSAVAESLRDLGAAHRRLGTVPEHYDPVGRSLLATLEHFLRELWTPALAADWAEAYHLVAEHMTGTPGGNAE